MNVTPLNVIVENYTKGISAPLLKEAIKICDQVQLNIQRNQELIGALQEYKSEAPDAYNNLYLTSLFSIIICLRLGWNSSRTIETVATGAFLHDIGILKLPSDIRKLDPDTMTNDERRIYMDYPRLGYNFLDHFPSVPEAVKQVVFQHQETCDGKGFPNALQAHHIFPMAKIVSLATLYTNILIKNRITPILGLRKMVSIDSFTQRYDSESIRALFSAFIKEKSK